MNRNIESALVLTAVAMAAVGAALLSPRSASAAGDITVDPTPFLSTASRAEVRAHVLKGPPLHRGDAVWTELPRTASAVSPAALRAEYQGSRELVKGFSGEDSGSAYLKAHPQSADGAATMGGPPEAPAGDPVERAPREELQRVD
jgi:hypothetical protein